MVACRSQMGIDQVISDCLDRGWADGLPVVPPYAELVDAMLAALGWTASATLARDEDLRLEIRCEHLASLAVMAGCLPSYARILRPLSEMLLAPTFGLRGVATTTGGVGIFVLISGPVVTELGFHTGANALGTPVRVNASIGRFAQLVRHICGRAGGLLEEFGTLGHPGRLSYLLAESSERVWPPFHTQFGFAAEESCVAIMAAEGPNSINNHYAETAEQVLETIALGLAHAGTTNYYYQGGGYVIVVAPEHLDLIAARFDRTAARDFIYERARMPTRELARLGRIPRQIDPARCVDLDGSRSPVARANQLLFAQAGGSAGKFSAVIPGWVTNVTHVKSLDSGRLETSQPAAF